MPSHPRFKVELAKEDFKFSAAHFTLFGEGRAEPLHGHNYRVRVRLEGSRLDDQGLLMDFAAIKVHIRRLCARLDDRTLIPDLAPEIDHREQAGQLEVAFGGRRYALPADEAVVLPLVNTSVELLARWLWEELVPALAESHIEAMAVSVEETSGQLAEYSASL